MKKLFPLAFIVIFPFLAISQFEFYHSGFDTPEEVEDWVQFTKGVEPEPRYKWYISKFNSRSADSCLSHNYPVGGETVTDNWFVSPQMDFSGVSRIDSLWYAFSGFGTPHNGDTIALYLLTGNQDPDLASSQQILILFSDSNYMNDNIWRFYSEISIPQTEEVAYLAFRYVTTINWLDVKFDDLYISSFVGIGEHKNIADQTKVYPNPTNNTLYFDIPDKASIEKIEVIDIAGKTVKEFHTFTNPIELSEIPEGIYLLNISTQEEIISKKIIKSAY